MAQIRLKLSVGANQPRSTAAHSNTSATGLNHQPPSSASTVKGADIQLKIPCAIKASCVLLDTDSTLKLLSKSIRAVSSEDSVSHGFP